MKVALYFFTNAKRYFFNFISKITVILHNDNFLTGKCLLFEAFTFGNLTFVRQAKNGYFIPEFRSFYGENETGSKSGVLKSVEDLR